MAEAVPAGAAGSGVGRWGHLPGSGRGPVQPSAGKQSARRVAVALRLAFCGAIFAGLVYVCWSLVPSSGDLPGANLDKQPAPGVSAPVTVQHTGADVPGPGGPAAGGGRARAAAVPARGAVRDGSAAGGGARVRAASAVTVTGAAPAHLWVLSPENSWESQ